MIQRVVNSMKDQLIQKNNKKKPVQQHYLQASNNIKIRIKKQKAKGR